MDFLHKDTVVEVLKRFENEKYTEDELLIMRENEDSAREYNKALDVATKILLKYIL
jgi:hypothetical protein